MPGWLFARHSSTVVAHTTAVFSEFPGNGTYIAGTYIAIVHLLLMSAWILLHTLLHASSADCERLRAQAGMRREHEQIES